MPYIHSKGSPSSDVWVITFRPLPGDVDRGYIYSSGLGFMFDKIMKDAGINDYYVTCLMPDTANVNACRNLDGELNQYQPKIILPIDAYGARLCDELIPKRQGKSYDPDTDSEISKYCGSLLHSAFLQYPHYVIPIIDPTYIAQQYKLRDQVLLDLVKAKLELDYIKANGCLQALPQRQLITNFSEFDELLYIIDAMQSAERVSNDIETIYPKAKEPMYGKTPGLPVVAALATSADYAISFDFFRDSVSETKELWTHLDRLFRNTRTIGQNFLNFDMYYYEMLGFEFPEDKVSDTLVRHHVLWPELPHKLQYLCRQYTREPYYKDEGQGWSVKKMDNLKRYNALDAAVTYEVWEAQEEEFKERPHLR